MDIRVVFGDISKFFAKLPKPIRALIVSVLFTGLVYIVFMSLAYFSIVSIKTRMPWIFVFIAAFLGYYLYDTWKSTKEKKLMEME